MDGLHALIERVKLTLFDRQQKVVKGRELILGDDRQRRRVAELHFCNAQMKQDRGLVLLHETRTTLKDRIKTVHGFSIVVLEQVGFS